MGNGCEQMRKEMKLFTMCNCQTGKDSLWRRPDGSKAMDGEAGRVQEAW